MVFQIRKIRDIGTSEPWVARLWFGMLKFRDAVYTGDERLAFDEKYAPVLDNLYECYRAVISLRKTIEEHEAKVLSQEIFHVQNEHLTVTETIDTEMNEAFKNFFIKGKIAINNLVPLSKFMGCNISFVLVKEAEKFEYGASRIPVRSPFVRPLVEKLRKHRDFWLLRFLNERDEIEHESLPKTNG